MAYTDWAKNKAEHTVLHNISMFNIVYCTYVIQRKEQDQLHIKRGCSDGSNFTKHTADTSDDTMPNASSIFPSVTAANAVTSISANGRTLVHRHGLSNGMPAQAE